MTYLALVGLPVCAAVVAYLLGFDNGYLRARRELRETSVRRARGVPAILGTKRRVVRADRDEG